MHSSDFHANSLAKRFSAFLQIHWLAHAFAGILEALQMATVGNVPCVAPVGSPVAIRAHFV